MSNSLMRGFHAGIIAGIISHIFFFSYNFLRSMVGHPSGYMPYLFSYDVWINYLIYAAGIGAIFGGIFGVIYSKFYNVIPGKGVKKGLLFGLIMGLFSNISYGSHHLLIGLSTASEFYLVWGRGLIPSFLAIFFLYGIVLGLLYERWK
jgi:hypothetical protein